VSADVGIDTTVEIIKRVEDRVAKDKYINTSELNNILQSEIKQLLVKPESGIASGENTTTVSKKPYVLLIVGVNGVGKTTSIGKLAYQFKQAGKSVMLGAADTFRAAAVDQLTIWSDRIGVPIVKKEMGSDPASVAFDAVNSAVAKEVDILIIDTAGRLHTKTHLMDELSKIKRVIQKVIPDAPHEVLLVLDGSTGQNAIEQAKQFTAATDVTGMIITKLDGTAKGGVVLAIAHQFKIPVRFIGVGEKMEDLLEFDAQQFVDSLFKLK
jgi:fused signal recognition particle receptor